MKSTRVGKHLIRLLSLCLALCLCGCATAAGSPDDQKNFITENGKFTETIWNGSEFRIHGVDWNVKEKELLPTLHGCKGEELNGPLMTYIEDMNGNHAAGPREYLRFTDVPELKGITFTRSYLFNASSGSLMMAGIGSFDENGELEKMSWEDFRAAFIRVAGILKGLDDSVVPGDDYDSQLAQLDEADGSSTVHCQLTLTQGDLVCKADLIWVPGGEYPVRQIDIRVEKP